MRFHFEKVQTTDERNSSTVTMAFMIGYFFFLSPVMSVLKAVLKGHKKAIQRVFQQHEEANTSVMLEMRKNGHKTSKLVGFIFAKSNNL